eukprot:1757505-Pyramimonas_sp.AAC.1
MPDYWIGYTEYRVSGGAPTQDGRGRVFARSQSLSSSPSSSVRVEGVSGPTFVGCLGKAEACIRPKPTREQESYAFQWPDSVLRAGPFQFQASRSSSAARALRAGQARWATSRPGRGPRSGQRRTR